MLINVSDGVGGWGPGWVLACGASFTIADIVGHDTVVRLSQYNRKRTNAMGTITTHEYKKQV